MPRFHTKSSTAAAAATVGVLLIAGCGSGTQPPAATAGHTGLAAQAYRFADCMRTHGVPSFPDPKISVSNGGQQVAIRAIAPASNAPAFTAASKACRPLLPGPGNQSPAQRLAHTADLLSFARCMRAHGISSFPDPTPQGRISREMLAAAHTDIALPNVQQAAFTCVPSAHGILTAAAIRKAINNGG